VGIADHPRGGARDRGAGLWDADRAGPQLDAPWDLLRALSHRLVVIKAIFIYNVIVDTGFFDTIRDSLG
jgi:hypothetical protein